MLRTVRQIFGESGEATFVFAGTWTGPLRIPVMISQSENPISNEPMVIM